MNPERLAFVMTAENNHTKAEAFLLAESVRRFAGGARTSEIHLVMPTIAEQFDESDRDRWAALGVELTLVEADFTAGFPQAGKIAAALWAERNLPQEILVVSDADSFFLREPNELLLGKTDFGAVPVWYRGVGSSGRNDPADQFWRLAFRVCELHPLSFEEAQVATLVDNRRIRTYFNSGLFSYRRSSKLAEEWLRCFLAMQSSSAVRECLGADRDAVHGEFVTPWFFLEQLALSVAVLKLRLRVRLLGSGYNFPIHLRAAGILDESSATGPTHAHYLRYLHAKEPSRRIAACIPTAMNSWLRQRTPLAPPMAVSWPPDFHEPFEDEMQRWRKELPRHAERPQRAG